MKTLLRLSRKAIRYKTLYVIAIAHRLSTIRGADRSKKRNRDPRSFRSGDP